jgi:cellulose synthase/poly-beta-1,6-N-acetylglucosamine synthase-like glycosyltransferase
MSILLGVLAIVIGVPGALASVHLTLLTIGSIFYREARAADPPDVRFLALVPAHNEEKVIGAALESITAAARPGDIILVVADRCTDATAAIARVHGAEVLERGAAESPGRAEAIRAGLRRAAQWNWDAVVTIDADSIVEAEFFESLEAVLGAGAAAAQARSEHIRERGVLARISEAAFAMQGVSLPRGRDRLGLGARLRGSGMTLRRDIIERTGFSTEGASEDLFYSLDLTLEGILARHVDSARLRSLSAPSVRAATQQRLRWESGRMITARTYLGRLLRSGRPAALESAVHLVTPPFAVAVFSVLCGALLGLLAGWTSAVVVFSILLGALALDLAVALIQSRAPLATWLALIGAPVYVLWKVWLQILAVVRVRDAHRPYDPTPRS